MLQHRSDRQLKPPNLPAVIPQEQHAEGWISARAELFAERHRLAVHLWNLTNRLYATLSQSLVDQVDSTHEVSGTGQNKD